MFADVYNASKTPHNSLTVPPQQSDSRSHATLAAQTTRRSATCRSNGICPSPVGQLPRFEAVERQAWRENVFQSPTSIYAIKRSKLHPNKKNKKPPLCPLLAGAAVEQRDHRVQGKKCFLRSVTAVWTALLTQTIVWGGLEQTAEPPASSSSASRWVAIQNVEENISK